MVCLGLEPGVAVWKAQTNPLNYGGTQIKMSSFGEKKFSTKKVSRKKPFQCKRRHTI